MKRQRHQARGFLRRRRAHRLRQILQQQHLATAIECRGRLGGSGGEHAALVIADLDDPANFRAHRKTTAKARGDQFVTDLDVGADRNVRQLQAIDRTGAIGDRAQAGAPHHDRNRMRGIGDQQGHRGVRQDFDDLPHDAEGIEYRLADLDHLRAAGIEDDAMAERIQIDVDQACQLDTEAQLVLHVEQLLQAIILRGQRRHPVQAHLGQQQGFAQVAVLVHQLGLRRHRQAARAGDIRGQCGHAIDRLDQGAGHGAQVFEIIAAMIDDHDDHGQGQVGDQARRADRTFGKQRNLVRTG